MTGKLLSESELIESQMADLEKLRFEEYKAKLEIKALKTKLEESLMEAKAKYKYIIFDCWVGSLSGTNDEDVAKNYATSEEYAVLNTERQQTLNETGKYLDIAELK